jgi:CheY-like chemotaxis protein/HPt (histidine-containing phosphotransfer) domain-containing protein
MAPKLSEEDMEDRLRLEFVDDARDRLQRMYETVERVGKGSLSAVQGISGLSMEAHNLKGCGTAFGYPAVSLVAHRLEDYITGLSALNERHIVDIDTYLDRASALVERSEQPDLAETNQILRALPVRYIFDVKDVEVHNVEVMLVTPSKVVARKVSMELAACGYRPIRVQDPIESISLAVRMPPDMLIASMVMDGLSGLDVIRGLKAMSVTRKVPMALLTSLDPDDAVLKEIPAGVGVIRLGPNFSEDVAAVITRFNLG